MRPNPRYSASLETAEWRIESTRQAAAVEGGAPGGLVSVRADDALVFEIDERGFVCEAAAAALPPLCFAGAGQTVARRLAAGDTMPTPTAVVVLGFRPPPMGLAAVGHGGRTVLHDAVHNSAATVEQLLADTADGAACPVPCAEMLELLARQDAQVHFPPPN
jgi:hypothetical protein